jgi:hypothetical protein
VIGELADRRAATRPLFAAVGGMLVARLALDDAGAQERAAAAVLAGSVIASLTALLLLRRRSR